MPCGPLEGGADLLTLPPQVYLSFFASSLFVCVVTACLHKECALFDLSLNKKKEYKKQNTLRFRFMPGSARQKIKGVVFFFRWCGWSPLFARRRRLFWVGDRFPFSLLILFTKRLLFRLAWPCSGARGVVRLPDQNPRRKNQMLPGPFPPVPLFVFLHAATRARVGRAACQGEKE